MLFFPSLKICFPSFLYTKT